jgi:hypothetical protein
MSELLDDLYLEWLYKLVGRQAEDKEHWRLLVQLYRCPFYMIVPNDDNRASDGVALRREFINTDRSLRSTREWLLEECSVLEMLIGLARHLAFEMDSEVGVWFWHLLENLGLTRYDDSRFHSGVINQTVERLVERQYSFDGTGGLFPLREPHNDQRHVELWFQMEAYLLERMS